MAWQPPPIRDRMAERNGMPSRAWARWFQNVLNSFLKALHDLTGNGILVRSGDSVYTRTISSSTGNIKVTDGDGVAGNPKLDVDPQFLAGRVLGTSGQIDVTDVGSEQVQISISASFTLDHGLLTGLGDDDHTQYYNSSRLSSWWSGKTTDDLAEGSTNLYYTDARVSANSDVAANTAHRGTTIGNPHNVQASDLVTGTPQTGTYTFGGGSSGDVASMTFENGILTAVTLVP